MVWRIGRILAAREWLRLPAGPENVASDVHGSPGCVGPPTS
jgi:hypothetical protein